MSHRPPIHTILNPAARKPASAQSDKAGRRLVSGGRETAFQAFLSQTGFPCVGAKAALARGGIETLRCGPITSRLDDRAIALHLIRFVKRWRRCRRLFTSFVVVFDGPHGLSERRFELAMWRRIQCLTDQDRAWGHAVAPGISSDPVDPHFALSFGGESFFAVGLHPNASRKARRFRCPAIVFNLHDQFRQLRADGRYESMRSTILRRDQAWSGSINPMLGRHGEQSEAPQYSGRQVNSDWKCPFHR